MNDRHIAQLIDRHGKTVDFATGNLSDPDDWCGRYKFEALLKKARPGDTIVFTNRRLSAAEQAEVEKADKAKRAGAAEADKAERIAAYRKAIEQLEGGATVTEVERQLETDVPF